MLWGIIIREMKDDDDAIYPTVPLKKRTVVLGLTCSEVAWLMMLAYVVTSLPEVSVKGVRPNIIS